MLTKPCRRPGCTIPIRKASLPRLRDAVYCSRACGAQHRVARGDHTFLHRTPEAIHRSAVKAGLTRSARAKKARLLAVAALVDQLLPKDWLRRFGLVPEDIARIKALLVRSYLQGHAAGYSAGHTKQRRHGQAAA